MLIKRAELSRKYFNTREPGFEDPVEEHALAGSWSVFRVHAVKPVQVMAQSTFRRYEFVWR
jgi:hypothetical protein